MSHLKRHLTYMKRSDVCMAACAGVTFTGDPAGSAAELVKALQGMIDLANLLNETDCDYFDDMEAARAALARVRLDGDSAEKEGKTK